ncbi:MAG TPA: hypothetical protein VIK52_08595 [Opitutaceae bacterium]
MKRLSPWLAAFLCLGFIAAPLFAASVSTSKGSSAAGTKLAATISQVTGIAISPLLGVSALGAYKYFSANTEAEKADLPWYGQPMYWLSGLLIVGAIAFKDIAGAAVPTGMKKPLDILETMENKLSGLVAAGAVIPFSMDTISSLISTGDPAVTLPLGLAVIHIGAADLSWLLNILMMPLGIAVFLMVWITAHTINVLIILSPWGVVDAVLKSIRLSVLGLLTLTSWINPWAGVILSLAIVVIAFFCTGWAFRLTIYGTIFCWDFFTRRRKRFAPDAQENWVFTARKIGKTPVRTYGRLSRTADGKLVLKYRPWLVLAPREMEMPDAPLSVGRGAFYPTVVGHFGEKERTLILLSPRYKGHEVEFGAACGITSIVDVGLRRAWNVIKDLFGLGVSNPAPVGA